MCPPPPPPALMAACAACTHCAHHVNSSSFQLTTILYSTTQHSTQTTIPNIEHTSPAAHAPSPPSPPRAHGSMCDKHALRTSCERLCIPVDNDIVQHHSTQHKNDSPQRQAHQPCGSSTPPSCSWPASAAMQYTGAGTTGPAKAARCCAAVVAPALAGASTPPRQLRAAPHCRCAHRTLRCPPEPAHQPNPTAMFWSAAAPGSAGKGAAGSCCCSTGGAAPSGSMDEHMLS